MGINIPRMPRRSLSREMLSLTVLTIAGVLSCTSFLARPSAKSKLACGRTRVARNGDFSAILWLVGSRRKRSGHFRTGASTGLQNEISLIISQRFRGFESTALRQPVLPDRDIWCLLLNSAAIVRTISEQRGPDKGTNPPI